MYLKKEKTLPKVQVSVALSRMKILNGIVLFDLEPNKIPGRSHDEKAFRIKERLKTHSGIQGNMRILSIPTGSPHQTPTW